MGAVDGIFLATEGETRQGGVMLRAGACLAFLSVWLLVGQAGASEPVVLWAVNDNDFWAFRGKDVDYSNGLEVHLRLPVRPAVGARWLQVGGALGHAIFTPPNLRETDPDVLRRERPYAGWLWGSVLLDGAWGAARLRFEARGGLVGPHAFGEEAQRAWHSTNRAPDPKGWGVAQVGDALDLGARLAGGVRLARIDLSRRSGGWIALDLGPEVSCEAGALRVQCGAGALLRLGLLRDAGLSSFGTLAVPVEPPARGADGPSREVFLFASVEGRHAPRERLLDGPVCGRDGCGPSWVRRAPSKAEGQLGVAFALGGWFAFFAHLWRTAELSAPAEAARPLHFGRVVLGRSW
jgi:hypothetical protein